MITEHWVLEALVSAKASVAPSEDIISKKMNGRPIERPIIP
jgi:hypothetical protein